MLYNLYSVAVNTRKIDLYIQAVLMGDRFPLPVNVLTARVDYGNLAFTHTPGQANKSAWTSAYHR